MYTDSLPQSDRTPHESSQVNAGGSTAENQSSSYSYLIWLAKSEHEYKLQD